MDWLVRLMSGNKRCLAVLFHDVPCPSWAMLKPFWGTARSMAFDDPNHQTQQAPPAFIDEPPEVQLGDHVISGGPDFCVVSVPAVHEKKHVPSFPTT